MTRAKADNRAPGYRTNPTHRVDIAPAADRVRVAFQGAILGDSRRARVVEETGYATVCYLPREDVAMGHLRRTAHRSHCPYKGDAGYWDVVVGETVAENAAWSYEAPFDEAADLGGLIAFWIAKLPGAAITVG